MTRATAADLEVGVMLGTFGSHATPAAFRRIATAASDLDFDAVWVGDHVVFPADIPDTYPFSRTGESPFDVSEPAYDAFEVLSHLAGVVDDVRLGTNTCIVPYRHPVTLAKQAFSLAGLSDGRFEFGVAPGWMETEFEVLDVPYEERGSRTDEFLDIFDRATAEAEFAFDGPHHSFQETGFHPVPEERPPVWIGGRSGAAFRRVGEYGDGWTIFWDHPDEVAAARERIERAWADFDREGDPGVAVVRPVDVGGESDRLLSGPPASVAADLDDYAAAGATRVVLDFFTTDVDEQIAQLERFADQVR
ncbi:MAG: TIGR03619 family F420-dependent LLM class oxidoreductase [Haloarculaceae archaeon]